MGRGRARSDLPGIALLAISLDRLHSVFSPMRYCTECSSALPPQASACPNCHAVVAAPPIETAPERQGPTMEGEGDAREELAAALRPDYELLRPLGRGGMGWVYLAREPPLKRLVAVKLLSPYLRFDDRARLRFQREARAAAVLSHPNLVHVYRVGETGERRLPYIVMQYVEGLSLQVWMAQHGRAGERDARRILGSVASALATAHARGLVHRDVKPGNILIESATGRAFVADFGIAAALTPAAVGEAASLTDSSAPIGTPTYMSPEQALGERVTPRSDVYSLGMVGYELLTGALPFKAPSSVAWMVAQIQDTPVRVRERRPDLAPELALLVDRCLAKRPADRPEADEVARGLMPSLGAEVEWPPPGTRSTHREGRRLELHAQIAAVAGLAVLWCLAYSPASTRALGPWWEHFLGSVREASASPLGLRRVGYALPQEALVSVWAVILVISTAVFALTCLRLLGLGRRGLKDCLAQRRLGWHWSTVLDVLADPDGRSGLILVGEREFATMPARDRTAVLSARRVQFLALVSAGLTVSALLSAWAIWVAGRRVASPGAGELVGGSTALILSALPAALLFVTVAATFWEARLLGPLPRRRSHVTTSAAPPTDLSHEEIAAWYSARSQAPPPPVAPAGSGPRTWPRAAYAVALIMGAVGSVALGLVTAATLVAAAKVRQLGAVTAELVDSLGVIARDDPLGNARLAWQPYIPPTGTSTVASGTAGTVNMTDQGSLSALLLALGSNPGQEPPETYVLRRGMRHDVTGDTLRLLERLASRAGAGGDVALAEPHAAEDYPMFREAMQANLLAAVVALTRGRPHRAEEYLGRNAALADRLLSGPEPFGVTFGAGALQSLALRPLAFVRESQGDTTTATELREAAVRIMGYVSLDAWGGSAAGLAADPDDWSTLLQMVTSREVLPAHRLAALGAAEAAACLNPREIVAGPSEERQRGILALADSMVDLPQAHTIARDETASLLPDAARYPAWIHRILRWPVAGGLVRLASCARWKT